MEIRELLGHPWQHEDLGIGCTHAWEAVNAGLQRLDAIAQQGTLEQFHHELSITDPVVTAFFMVSRQRALFFLVQGVGGMQFNTSLFGGSLKLPSDDEIAMAVAHFAEMLAELTPRLEKRLESLHQDDDDKSQPHELAPWAYPPLPAFGGSNTPGESLDEDDDETANRLLSSLSFNF